MSHRIDALLGAVIAVPATLFAVATKTLAEQGFDAVTAALYALAVTTAIGAVSILRGIYRALTGTLAGQMPLITDAATRRYIVNPLRRWAGLPPLPIGIDDEE